MTRKIISVFVLLVLLLTPCAVFISCEDKDAEESDGIETTETSDVAESTESTDGESDNGNNDNNKDESNKNDNDNEQTSDTQLYGGFHFGYGN